MNKPKTLQQAIVFFANPDNALAYMVKLRWPRGVECPTCGRKDVVFLTVQRKWQCKSVHAKRQFTAKIGTIFEDSPISLDKWLTAMWMLTNCKNGISSYEIARTIGVTQKSAWFMMHRIRLGMQTTAFRQLGGKGKEIEVDETFIGGKAINMHAEKHNRRIRSTRSKDKTAVFGILERGGEVRASVIPNRKRSSLHPAIVENVKEDTAVYSDALLSYDNLRARYEHGVIDHAYGYVRGRVHTNGLENFWSLLKRSIKGTYVSVEPFHLQRYVTEQVFRYNNRKQLNGDSGRFEHVAANILGKRITYAELTGKVGTTNLLPN
jgi:transposase-like protein